MVGVDAETGEDLWSFSVGNVDYPIRDPPVNADPEILGDRLLFSSEDFNVYLLNIKTGEEIWRVRLLEEPQARDIPVVDGIAYIGDWSGYLYAIDIEAGEIRWRSETDNDHIGEILYDHGRGHYFKSVRKNGETKSAQQSFVTAAPVIKDDIVYFADTAGNLLAVDRETGRQIWRFRPDDIADVRFAGSRFFIAEHDGVVYYSTVLDKRLIGVNAKTGKEVWSVNTSTPLYGPVKIAEGVALVLRMPNDNWQDFEIDALDLETRKTIWTLRNVSSFRPHVENDVAFFSFANGSIRGVKIVDGEEVWRLPDCDKLKE